MCESRRVILNELVLLSDYYSDCLRGARVLIIDLLRVVAHEM